MSTVTTSLNTLTAKDLASDQEVRWCPGCGDYSILAQMKKALAPLGVPREKMVFVSGIGCSSRFPYYMNLKIVLFNNEIYGLTKGQYSPTSRLGTRTKSSPQGSIDNPLRPLSLAIGAEATFVARTIDVDVNHLTETLKRAAAHKGTAFIEVYQNCKIFNDGVFDYTTDKSMKSDNVLYLEHGRPLIFGKDRNKGIRLHGMDPEVVQLGSGVTPDDLLIHDEKATEPSLAYLLSRMVYPEFPECAGVFRAVERPTYGEVLDHQIGEVVKARGPGNLAELLTGDETWVVE
jgi:2-oxoglutarate ferredoxin oxidoreductase subunit beta